VRKISQERSFGYPDRIALSPKSKDRDSKNAADHGRFAVRAARARSPRFAGEPLPYGNAMCVREEGGDKPRANETFRAVGRERGI
jgi:hypothetical protein